ncbi:SusC/RagA family TonB-linked outer membrane protein [Aestuariivivens sediminis]|uniref:SusC/RagA family TonB-linked outer membrane protein n=1 Tax=Aestuariivivens sediminis TaxID=2913557 RepID=UPI001F59993F|nr:SusC/RagA family TonB-linked outer membrane protein [Aestuariivivens sediminis]
MKTNLRGVLTFFLMLAVQFIFAQSRTISGSVSDNSGLPLPGATVLIKGTSSGTSTDFDGNYTIRANQGDVLVVSFVGYVTAELTVGASNTINISMQEDTAVLEEVVVTAFGIKRNPKKLGYAVSKVSSDEITENSEPDLIRSLSGKVAGVNVNFSTGVAGAANLINIRGQTTIGSSTQPLIIVDGIAYDNTQAGDNTILNFSNQTLGGGSYETGLSSLDPNDIASVNVLKSVAASALYGSRAANGVIVITTKSGSAAASTNKKLSVNLSSGTYFETIANLPVYQNTYGPGTNFNYVNANGSWGPRFDALETIPTWPNLLNAFPDLFGPTVPWEPQPDNVKNLFKTGVVLDNSVNLAFGGENGSFSVTVSDLQQEGYIPFNTYDRTSLSSGGNFKLQNGITIGASLSFSNTDQTGGFYGENQFGGSASSFARALWLGRSWDLSLPYEDANGASVTPNNGWDHPLWSWEHDQIVTKTNRTVGNINLSFPINDNISTSFRIGFNKYILNRRQIRDPQSRASLADGGSIINIDFTNEDIESTFLVNFDYDLTKTIGLTGVVGANVLQNTAENFAITGSTFISPGIRSITNTVTQAINFDRSSRERTFGTFAEIGLSYEDFLFLNATGRNDWSSTLPKDNRSYFYPSVSTSLIVTEAFDMNSDILTFAKLRAGYAEAGRSAPAEFLNTTFATGNPFNSIPVVGNRVGLGDQEITPEFTKEFEIGTDLEFFNRRLVLDFSLYKKITTDLISPVTVPSSSGFTSFNTNIGEMENKGVEIGLTVVPIQTEDFNWSLFTTFTKNDNVVTELVEGLDRIQFEGNGNQVPHVIAGQPFGVFYGSKFARDPEGNFIIDPATGYVFNSADNDALGTTANGIIGDPNPDFKMSFINTIRYKNLTLSAQFDWREGGDIHSTSIQSMLGRGVTKDTEDRERTVIIPGFYGDSQGNLLLDSSGNPIPNTTQLDINALYFTSGGPSGTFGQNAVDEASVYDGTVYRLRELSLSYQVPTDWLKKTPFGKISLSAIANNLWYFAPNVPKYTNFDPEVTSHGTSRLQGVEIASPPTATRYGFKVNVTF